MRQETIIVMVVAVLFVAVLLWSFVRQDTKPGASLTENVAAMRKDGVLQDFKKELLETYSDCIARIGRFGCVSKFVEMKEADLAACLQLFDNRLCTLTLQVVAEDHGWSISKPEREAPLYSSSGTLKYHADCIEKVDKFNCLSRWVLLMEDAFDICDDLWQREVCAQIINDLLAAAGVTAERNTRSVPIPVPTSTPTATPIPPVSATSTPTSQSFTPPSCATTDCDCSHFRTQRDAQRFFEWAKTQPKPNPGSSRGRPGDWHGLDADRDGRVCETLP